MTEKGKWVERLISIGFDVPGIIAFFKESLKNGIEARRKNNPRSDVMRTIQALKQEKAKILMQRLEEATKTAKPDFENEVVVALGDILPRDKDGNVIEKSAIQIYEWIADLSEENFAVFVSAMKHDPIWQVVRYYLDKYGFDGLKRIAGFLFEALSSEEIEKFFAEFEQWCSEQLQKIKKSLIGMVVFPLIFIIPGAFLGGINWTLKLIVVQLGIWAATFYLLRLSRKRLLIGSELATVIEVINSKTKYSLHSPIADIRQLMTDILKGVEDYIRLVAAVLASEIAVGFIALWLPGHKNPLMVPLILLAAMALITHTIWMKGKLWWPKLVYRLAIFTLVASVVSVFFVQTMNEVSTRLRLDERIASQVKEILPTESEKAEKEKRAAQEVVPIYGTYNFSLATVPGEVEIPFRPDSFSEVTLPAAIVFRTDPSNDVEIIFIDGSRYLDGPAKQVWYGLKRGIFKIRGLKEAGVLKITLEKKI